MGLNGYTGPTSGRITIAGDGEVTERQTFTDPPLTREEARDTKWFTDLSPMEQVRTARRLKWNAAEWEQRLNAARNTIREQDNELRMLRAKLATFTPEGFEFPKGARDLEEHAKAHGWQAAHAWTVDPRSEGDGTVARLEVAVRHGFWLFQIAWVCHVGGRGHMAGRGLARRPGRDWHDAPPLVKIKSIITEVGNGS